LFDIEGASSEVHDDVLGGKLPQPEPPPQIDPTTRTTPYSPAIRGHSYENPLQGCETIEILSQLLIGAGLSGDLQVCS
jgi:hypothetical protein